MQNSNKQFKPGMYAEVQIPMLSGSKSLLVPTTAIVRSTERKHVVAVRDGKAHLIDVKNGLASHDSTEVFGALKPGEKIIINASDNIGEGDPVK